MRFEAYCGKKNGNKTCETGPVQRRPAGLTLLGGVTGTLYRLTIRVRGIAEEQQYTDAVGGAASGIGSDLFAIDGVAAGDLGWNTYTLKVTDPPHDYRLNRGKSKQYYTRELDYRATILAKANSTVSLESTATDSAVVININAAGTKIVPPDPPEGIEPGKNLDGQVIQIDVERVEIAD